MSRYGFFGASGIEMSWSCLYGSGLSMREGCGPDTFWSLGAPDLSIFSGAGESSALAVVGQVWFLMHSFLCKKNYQTRPSPVKRGHPHHHHHQFHRCCEKVNKNCFRDHTCCRLGIRLRSFRSVSLVFFGTNPCRCKEQTFDR